ncbi:hypothetical protein ABK040_016332 [Willaertia magna]
MTALPIQNNNIFVSAPASPTTSYPIVSLQASPFDFTLPTEYLYYQLVKWVELGHFATIELMIRCLEESQECNIKTKDLLNGYDKMFNRYPLYSACSKGLENVVRLLLNYNIDIDCLSGGKTSLWAASQKNFKNIVKLLLKKGANSSIICCSKTAEEVARENGFEELAEYIKHFDYEKYKVLRQRKILYRSNLNRHLSESSIGSLGDISFKFEKHP